MEVKMHRIRPSQIGYYRHSLEYLNELIERDKKDLDELESDLKEVKGEYTIYLLEGRVEMIKNHIEKMEEVYNLRIENPSISDEDFVEMAINQRKEDLKEIRKRGEERRKKEEERRKLEEEKKKKKNNLWGK